MLLIPIILGRFQVVFTTVCMYYRNLLLDIGAELIVYFIKL